MRDDVKLGDVWFRYEDGPAHYFGWPFEPDQYEVVKVTPCGCRVRFSKGSFSIGRDRFVLIGARKQYAWPTAAEALESYRARKRKQIRIYSAKLAEARRCLAVAGETYEFKGFSWVSAPVTAEKASEVGA